MTTKHPKRPRDPNELAKLVTDIATGDATDTLPLADTPTQEFARLGGRRGGVARAEKLTAEQRREIAKKGAASRWHKA